MRSMFMLAAFAAAISFTGCCGAGGQAGGCKLGGILSGGKATSSQLGRRSAARASVGDCGCGETGGCGATGVCGADSVVSVSAPCPCEAPMNAHESMSTPVSAPSSCGCSSCGGGEVQYAPMPVSMPVSMPAESGGCSACDSASVEEPRGILTRKPKTKRSLGGKKGLGLCLKGKGKACQETRSLAPASDSMVISDQGVSTCDSCDSCSECVEQTVAQMPEGYLFGSSRKGRRISSGIHSGTAEVTEGYRPHRCGKRGCGVGGRLCSSCSELAAAAGVTHPYGGAIPHTNPATGRQPQSGIAPQYAYPYYTTRGPRDFLQDNPPSIGY